MVVWSDTFPKDGPAGAEAAGELFDDPRVRQFHDPHRGVGQHLAPHVGMPTLAKVAQAQGVEPSAFASSFRPDYVSGPAAVFDTVLFFGPDARWESSPPPPVDWVTQLDPSTFLLDSSRFHWGAAMGDEIARMARALLEVGPNRPPSRRIWDAAPHCAFGDLLRFRGRFVATHREASGHVPPTNGKIRVIASDDGDAWESIALIEEPGIDLRDPKLSVMPDGRLMLTCGGSDYSDGLLGWHTRAAFSSDGRAWTAPARVRGIPPSNWFFRLTWHEGIGYAMPNLCGEDPATGRIDRSGQRIALFVTRDGLNYERVGDDLEVPSTACEASLAFEPDGTMLGVLRDEGQGQRGSFLLTAEPPYVEFGFERIEHGLGGPNLLRLADGTLLLGTREYSHDRPGDATDTVTVVLGLQLDGSFQRLVELQSGGDTSYPGMLVHEGELWVQYYSSHEESTAVYLARVDLADLAR